MNNHDARRALDKIQSSGDSPGQQARKFRHEILKNFNPCFHRYFTDTYREPTAWFEARTTFSRSAALWSAVGHVVGLGDRHGENILLEARTGACVHVDVECLFDKGLNLAKPEVVPFRLTQHMREGMGPVGYDGVFRSVMEVTMRVLRDEEAMLIAVLEPFLNDPTLGWAKSQRADSQDAGVSRRGKPVKDFDARAVVSTTRGRLRGAGSAEFGNPEPQGEGGGERGGPRWAQARA